MFALILSHKFNLSWNVIPEEASRRSSLLTSQSRLSQNNAQLERFPLIREAARWEQTVESRHLAYIKHSASFVQCLCSVSTQQLIKQIDNFLPGFSSFLSSELRKVRSSVVHVQPVDAFQNNGDHSLRKQHRKAFVCFVIYLVVLFLADTLEALELTMKHKIAS